MELVQRVLTAAVLIPVVLAIVLRAPVPVLAAVAGLVALLAIHELLNLSEGYGIRPLRAPTYIYCALFFLILAVHPGNTDLLSTGSFIYFGICAAVFAPFLFLSLAMRGNELRSGFPSALVAAFAFVYIALPMASLVQLREQWRGAFLLLYLLLLVWAGDIFAYFIGKPLGRHRMSPRISPKKSWEGAVASVVASVGVGILMFRYAQPISTSLMQAHLIKQSGGIFTPKILEPVILLSILLNIAAQLGDLVESLIKRGAGVKDSGAILPGHGGMFDRIDALLFAAPVLWAWAAWHTMI
ncbi:MAG TPA: phosphatidate cytidylyltransferase [Terriglobales bacterium]|nr:phosphatidate cytidylyltransferase [Terriglobales bacterium]